MHAKRPWGITVLPSAFKANRYKHHKSNVRPPKIFLPRAKTTGPVLIRFVMFYVIEHDTTVQWCTVQSVSSATTCGLGLTNQLVVHLSAKKARKSISRRPRACIECQPTERVGRWSRTYGSNLEYGSYAKVPYLVFFNRSLFFPSFSAAMVFFKSQLGLQAGEWRRCLGHREHSAAKGHGAPALRAAGLSCDHLFSQEAWQLGSDWMVLVFIMFYL